MIQLDSAGLNTIGAGWNRMKEEIVTCDVNLAILEQGFIRSPRTAKVSSAASPSALNWPLEWN